MAGETGADQDPRQKLQHLNAVLEGLREIDRLLARERDAQRLIDKVAELLVRTRGFDACAVALVAHGRITMFARSSRVPRGELLGAMLGRARLPACMKRSLSSEEPVVLVGPEPTCAGCGVERGLDEGRRAVAVKLASVDRTFGSLLAVLPRGLELDELERDLIAQVGADLGFALHGIEMRTERLEAEQRAAESARRLTTLMSNLSGMAYRCRNDAQWNMEFVSEGTRALTGYDPKDLVMSRMVSYAELILPEDRGHVWQEVQSAVDQRRSFVLEYRIRDAHGAVRWVWEKGAAVTDERGKVVALEGFIMDITQLVEARVALRKTEATFRSLFDAIHEGVAVHQLVRDAEGKPVDYRITEVNPAFARHTGIAARRAVGALGSELYGTGEAPFLDVYTRVVETGEPHTFEVDFAPMAKRFRITVYSQEGDVFSTVFTDVTA